MMPNFFIVGAAKSGTTSLWYYLKQHPQVFFPNNKEPNFFAFEGLEIPPFTGPASPEVLRDKIYLRTITQLSRYQDLFKKVSSEKAVGEASVRYLYFPQASQKIHAYLPSSKIIIILRNPIDRLYSHYLMMKGQYCLEPLELDEALEQEGRRIAADWGWDWHYVKVSLYFEQVKRYLDLFGAANVRVLIYEDFCQKPLKVIQEIFEYLDVDSDFTPDVSSRRMQAYWPRNSGVDKLLRTPNKINTSLAKILPEKTYKGLIRHSVRLNKGQPPSLSPKIKEKLQETFQPDILNLENLLGRKLPW
ncbi:MAG: sulfotransferase [Limnothrix sp. RL_2_0]|nr:sulfotransferase [Limnothrix sp. RL_2_0]